MFVVDRKVMIPSKASASGIVKENLPTIQSFSPAVNPLNLKNLGKRRE